MKRRHLIILSHGILALAGFFGARLLDASAKGGPDASGAGSASSGERSGVGSESRPTRPGAGNFNQPGPSKQSRFRAAWDALPDQQLTKPERLAAQRRMLLEWAKFDLAGAMEQALDIPWDDTIGNGANSSPMVSVFADAFAEDPAGTWDLIHSGRFGLGSSLLRSSWIQAVGKSDPLTLAGSLSAASWRDRDAILDTLENARNGSQELGKALVDTLSGLPEEVLSAEDLMRFVPELSLEEIHERMATIDDFSDREAKLLVLQLTQKQSAELRQREDPNEVVAIVRENMSMLPEDAQGEFIHQVLKNSLPPEKSMAGGRQTFALVDLLVEGEHWDLLDNSYSRRRVSKAEGIPAEERAAWALTLPPSREVFALFHQSVKDYVSKSPEEAWRWIGGISDPVWRDRAYGEFASRAINERKEYEASRRALDQISDQEYRTIQEDKRPDWAKAMDE